MKSSFEVAFDLLSVCEVMFIRKSHGGLDLLTEATLRERFNHLRSNLRALYCAYYVAELLADGTFDYDPHPVLFDQSLECLRGLARPSLDVTQAVSGFELVWLRELGYSPRFEDCAVCGTAIGDEVRVEYSPTTGGILCAVCSRGIHDRRWLSLESRSILRRLNREEVEIPAPMRGEIRMVLGQTVSAVLGRRPKMLAYLDGVG